MSPRIRLRLGLVLLVPFMPLTLQAQAATCADVESVVSCWHRLMADDPQRQADVEVAAVAVAGDSLSDRLARKVAGLAGLGPGFASTLSDFLPGLVGALGLTQTTTEDGATSLETNLLLPIGASPQRFRLRGLLRKPDLYQPLQDSLPADRLEPLRKELGDFDDVQLSLSWNLETRTFGRGYRHALDVYDPLYRAQRAEFYRIVPRRSEAMAQMQAFQMTLGDADLAASPSAELGCPTSMARMIESDKLPFGCLTMDKQREFAARVAAAVAVTKEEERALDEHLTRSGFYRLSDLVNNQPQLSLELAGDLRRDLVGPNGFTASARYESGFANLNGLRARCRTGGEISTSCLQQYLTDPAVQSSLARGDRFFVSADYSRRQDYRLQLPADTVSIALAGTWDVSVSAGYGRYITFDRTGAETGRLDLTAEYIFHHNDPMRENRLVAAGTYTYRLSESLAVAAGASYASKPEFLGDVTRRFGANFGLRYKLLKS
jgi:hypothetical protein